MVNRMKHYEKLLALGCFSKHDIERITGSEAAAKWLCQDYLKKGYIERVKRDLYVAISLETRQSVASRYRIASHISDDATVSFHSAFEFYGYANQVFYEVQVTSANRFRDFDYDGVTYKRIAPRITGGIVESGGVRVTTLERTVIDCIHLFEKVGGLEELLRCVDLIPTLDEAALAECLAEYGSRFLYQKTGYLLSPFAASLGLSPNFFDLCKVNLPKGKSYLYSNTQGFVWHEQWKLYAPPNPIDLIQKGVTDYDAI